MIKDHAFYKIYISLAIFKKILFLLKKDKKAHNSTPLLLYRIFCL